MAGFMKAMDSFAILLFLLSTAAADVNPFCDTADDKVFCTQLAKGAQTWTDAMTNVLKATLKKAKAGKRIPDDIAKLLPPCMKTVTRDSIIQTCKDSYNNIIYNVESCIEYVKNDPTGALRSYLSATSFIDCTDTLIESQITSAEATQFGSEIRKLAGILLAMAEKKPQA